MSRSLITGGKGLLAPYLTDALSALGPVAVSMRSGGEWPAELTDGDAVARLIAAVRPDVVVHCAAATDVDLCERQPELADAANRQTTRNLVTSLRSHARLVLISTDQVYPDTEGPHREGGEAPVNAYGRSKLGGEKEALKCPDALVLRTNFFGPSRSSARASLSDWIIKGLTARQPMTLFEDSLFSPLHMTTVASILRLMIERGSTGTFNLGSRAGMSKADFGMRIAGHLGLPTETVRIGAAASVPGRARRASDLRMSVTRIEAALGHPMPTLADEISKLQL